MARVYADVNQHMPKSYWEYDSVNITWGVLENYEVVRKIGIFMVLIAAEDFQSADLAQAEGNIQKSSKASTSSTTRSVSSRSSNLSKRRR